MVDEVTDKMRNTHSTEILDNAQYALRVAHYPARMGRMKTGEKIRQIRLARGLTIAEVEDQAGLSNGNLSRVERGAQWLSEAKLNDLAKALGVSPADFFTDKFDQNVAPVVMGSVAVPVISAVQAGKLKEISDPYPPGAGQDVVYTNQSVSNWSFALEIAGVSMTPDFNPGDIVIIDPNLQPRPGDYVVAKNGSEEATFKKYRPRGMNSNGDMVFELVPLNDDFPTMRSDIERLEVIGVMVEHRRLMRR